MSAFIDKLFPESQANAIRALWTDESSKLLVERAVGQRLLEYKGIIEELPLTQLMFLASLSPFASSSDECHDVAEIVYWGIGRNDILPLITEHNGRELANRCLLSLGFYKKALIRRCERHGAPSPQYYREAGISSFKKIGMDSIGRHFIQWENFIGEIFFMELKQDISSL